ncbi:MAG: copper-containing nitrite reductase [Bacteroidales bacterium]|jgi:nitrite reductase (NO-forming)|nr:copper-containing nitrite reductase [Bacteroidales bacterium]MCK9448654.1 copper-containing nitrite reductase [Bacteroidales bacterium]MDD3702191.1 copper-containing nitrite reductase [Bacteroidales bacterium]MDY0368935.1 copper-containing nitrite reductase [Bacteroidales bacterium]
MKRNTYLNFFIITLVWMMLFSLNSCKDKSAGYQVDLTKLPDREVFAELTDAPYVPPSRPEKGNAFVRVDLEIIEKTERLADGVDYTFWTFGGQVPGKFIRIRQGDLVEFHLHNHPDNLLPHNIDLHAVTGPGGGAEASLIAPGKSAQFTFRALNQGLYVYHCATAPVGMHIANGMYGLILVEPLEGLPPVDHEFYIMQSEFYTTGSFGEKGHQDFDMQKAMDERPDYVVMNGAVGAASGNNRMKVKVGETVRLFIGNGGPNLVSSFHVIGEIFNKVYVEGGTLINKDVQTTLVPAGGAAIAEFKCEVPGTLHLVDHSIFRAFNKGALAQIEVQGEEQFAVFTGKQKEEVYLPEGSAIQSISSGKRQIEQLDIPEKTLEERITAGQILYKQNCMACHMENGSGITGTFPPLVNSDFLQARSDHGIGVVLDGLQGEIMVNGVKYNNIMPAVSLNDDQAASVITYVLNNFDNGGGLVTAAKVKEWRNEQK